MRASRNSFLLFPIVAYLISDHLKGRVVGHVQEVVDDAAEIDVSEADAGQVEVSTVEPNFKK